MLDKDKVRKNALIAWSVNIAKTTFGFGDFTMEFVGMIPR